MRAVAYAVVAAALFGAATPASKALLDGLSPFQLAGLLYLGAALGVVPFAFRQGGLRLPGKGDRINRLRLVGAVAAGGIVGPVLLLFALRLAEAASVSLWLSFELVATAVLGAVLFREPLGLAGWVAVAAAIAGTLALVVPAGHAGIAAALLVAGACVCWGFDNHLTALIDGITPSQSTFWKGLVAGACNLVLGFAFDPFAGSGPEVLAALGIGAISYGASIVLYISAAQLSGATRAQVGFATAPLFGVGLSALFLGEQLQMEHGISALLFAGAVALLMHERHAHRHVHRAMRHEHAHRHDDGHHTHHHEGLPPETAHSHPHDHPVVVHAHPHWPDLHHRHRHD